MIRRITTHHTNKCNKNTTLEVSDAMTDPSSDDGGKVAPSVYTLSYLAQDLDWSSSASVARQHEIKLQKGPIAPDGQGTNGWTIEALLAIAIDQIECFQRSKFKNEYNTHTLGHLYNALESLSARTRDRELRGVEGTHTP